MENDSLWFFVRALSLLPVGSSVDGSGISRIDEG